jgi:cation transport protein ChaC
MGDALLARFAARPARLPGYHRAFVHESRRRWGRPSRPCPIVGLAPGGECWGLLFRIPGEDSDRVRRALERREAAEERKRERLVVESPDGPVEASVWVSDEGHARPIACGLDEVAERLRAAHGDVGTGTEYVRSLVHALELHGLDDPLVDALWSKLRG